MIKIETVEQKKWSFSDDDKKEIDKIIPLLEKEALSNGYLKSWTARYLKELYWDIGEHALIDKLTKMGVTFLKDERDYANCYTIFDYIESKTKNDKGEDLDNLFADKDSLENLFFVVNDAIKVENLIIDFLVENPEIRKMFVKKCVEELER